MARETDRRKTSRTEVDLRSRDDPRIEQQRRFFTSQGNDSATRNARALENAFGVAVGAYGDKLDRDNVVGNERAVEQAGAGGTRNQEDENAAYHRTWDLLDDQRALQAAEKELPELLRNADAENLPEEERQKIISDYMKGQVGGLENDDKDHTALGMGLLTLEAEQLGIYRDLDLQKIKAGQNAETYSAFRDEYERTGVADYALLAERTGTFNEGADRMIAFWESIYDLSEDMGDSPIIDNVPERFASGDPTGINDPKLQKRHNAARASADLVAKRRATAADEAFEAANQTRLAATHSQHTSLAKAGDPSVIPMIIDGGEDGPNGEPRMYSRQQQKTLFDQYYDAQLTAGVDAALGNEFATGNLIGGTQSDYDRAHAAFINNPNLQASLPEDPEELADALLTLTIERSVTMDRLPSVLKDQLTVNVNNPAKYKQARELYERLEAQLPGFVETQIDDKKARQLATYNRLLQDYGSEEQALKALSEFDPKRAASSKTLVDDAVDAAVGTLVDKPWSAFNHTVTPELRRRVQDEVVHYVNLGYTPEEAGKFAHAAIDKRSVRIGDYLYASDAGWGAQPEEELKWAAENEARHRGVDADSIRIVPHPRKHDVVLVQDMDAILPGTGFQMKVADISSAYKRFQSEVSEQSLDKGIDKGADSVDLRKEAEERAKARTMHVSRHIEPGIRTALESARDARWKALTQGERDLLIQQELTQQ